VLIFFFLMKKKGRFWSSRDRKERGKEMGGYGRREEGEEQK